MSEPNAETAKLLPAAGEGRWWKVETNTRQRQNPITVTLMESYSGSKRALSKALASEYTIADPKRVAETASIILARIGDYAKVVGLYGGE